MRRTKDAELKISKRGVLREALQKLGREGEPIRDAYGIIGYSFPDFILVAKPMPYGEIVSCHKDIIWKAIREAKKILFYIAINEAFYEFDPRFIMSHPESFVNRRRNIEMINFSIRWGKRANFIPKAQLSLF